MNLPPVHAANGRFAGGLVVFLELATRVRAIGGSFAKNLSDFAKYCPEQEPGRGCYLDNAIVAPEFHQEATSFRFNQKFFGSVP
jgi:hypothetical protein